MRPRPHTHEAIVPAIAYIWLAFYMLAITHALISPRFSPTIAIAQAEAAAPSLD